MADRQSSEHPEKIPSRLGSGRRLLRLAGEETLMLANILARVCAVCPGTMAHVQLAHVTVEWMMAMTAIPGIFGNISRSFRSLVAAAPGAVGRGLVSAFCAWWAYTRTPIGGTYFTLAVATLFLSVWDAIVVDPPLALQVATGIVILGWAVLGAVLLWHSGRAVAKAVGSRGGR